MFIWQTRSWSDVNTCGSWLQQRELIIKDNYYKIENVLCCRQYLNYLYLSTNRTNDVG